MPGVLLHATSGATSDIGEPHVASGHAARSNITEQYMKTLHDKTVLIESRAPVPALAAQQRCCLPLRISCGTRPAAAMHWRRCRRKSTQREVRPYGWPATCATRTMRRRWYGTRRMSGPLDAAFNNAGGAGPLRPTPESLHCRLAGGAGRQPGCRLPRFSIKSRRCCVAVMAVASFSPRPS